LYILDKPLETLPELIPELFLNMERKMFGDGVGYSGEVTVGDSAGIE
jgi:hypothetical protein